MNQLLNKFVSDILAELLHFKRSTNLKLGVNYQTTSLLSVLEDEDSFIEVGRIISKVN